MNNVGVLLFNQEKIRPLLEKVRHLTKLMNKVWLYLPSIFTYVIGMMIYWIVNILNAYGKKFQFAGQPILTILYFFHLPFDRQVSSDHHSDFPISVIFSIKVETNCINDRKTTKCNMSVVKESCKVKTIKYIFFLIIIAIQREDV